MTVSSRFWDRVAERYARKPVPVAIVHPPPISITISLSVLADLR